MRLYWDSVLTGRQIQSLADGSSPLGGYIEVKDSTNVTGAPSGTSSKSSLNLKDSYLELSNPDLQNEIQNNDNGSLNFRGSIFLV